MGRYNEECPLLAPLASPNDQYRTPGQSLRNWRGARKREGREIGVEEPLMLLWRQIFLIGRKTFLAKAFDGLEINIDLQLGIFGQTESFALRINVYLPP